MSSSSSWPSFARVLEALGSCCGCCCGASVVRRRLYEPLPDAERSAVADLLMLFEDIDDVDFFRPDGHAFHSLSIVAYSDHAELQRSAATAFVKITENLKGRRLVSREATSCLIYLLQSHDPQVQRDAAAAVGTLAAYPENQSLMVDAGALDPLVGLMNSTDANICSNAVGAITNLAMNPENKERVAFSGACVPLIKHLRSKDLRVQRNACGAILNITNNVETRQALITAGAIAPLVQLLASSDFDVVYYAVTSVTNLAVDEMTRARMTTSEPTLVTKLITLLSSPSFKIQCQACLALRNLASDEKYQLEICSRGGIAALVPLLHSKVPQTVLAASSLARNVSISPSTHPQLVPLIPALIELLSYSHDEIQTHSVSALRNLCGSDIEDDKAMKSIVEAGGVECLLGLIKLSVVGDAVKGEMCALLTLLVRDDTARARILSKGVKTIVGLCGTSTLDLAANAAAVIGNLAAKEGSAKALRPHWTAMRSFLFTFLASDITELHTLALWTLVQLLNDDIQDLVSNDSQLLDLVKTLGGGNIGSPGVLVNQQSSEGSIVTSLGSEGVSGAEVVAQLVRAVLLRLPINDDDEFATAGDASM